MTPTLNLQTCQRIAEVVKLETTKYWLERNKKVEWFLGNINDVENNNDAISRKVEPWYSMIVPCPTTLPEFIELFKKLGKKKVWSPLCNVCFSTIGTKQDEHDYEMDYCWQCDDGKSEPIEEWKHHLLRFTDLAATDWGQAEEYLTSLL